MYRYTLTCCFSYTVYINTYTCILLLCYITCPSYTLIVYFYIAITLYYITCLLYILLILTIQRLHPTRPWRMVHIDVSSHERDLHEPHVRRLIYPADTQMDLNIGTSILRCIVHTHVCIFFLYSVLCLYTFVKPY